MIRKPINIHDHQYDIDCPDQCPVCHHHSEIGLHSAISVENRTKVQVIFKCGYTGCSCFFIGYYPSYKAADHSKLISLHPQKPKIEDIPESINKLSPQFVEIYTQAEEARQNGLMHITGPGYRKAFEFLIKDYAKSLNPGESSEIEKSFSGDVLKKYITDPRIPKVAKRALWLGNDETHYLKKWNQHDVEDLITLIRLTIRWIEIEQLSSAYESSMPE